MSNKSLVLLVVSVLAISGIIFGAAFATQRPNKPAGCGHLGQTHTVLIHGAKVSPRYVEGKHCDVLRITNDDAVTREIAFGEHDRHAPYDDVSDKVLRQHDTLTVVMNKKGTYDFHDHFHDAVTGVFGVR